MEYALEVRNVSLRFGGVRALTDVSFGVREGELFSIIGPNGAGKTSIVNCISGRYRPTEGQLFYRGRDITGLSPNTRPARPPPARCPMACASASNWHAPWRWSRNSSCSTNRWPA